MGHEIVNTTVQYDNETLDRLILAASNDHRLVGKPVEREGLMGFSKDSILSSLRGQGRPPPLSLLSKSQMSPY